MKRFLWPIILALITGLMLVGCSNSQKPASVEKKEILVLAAASLSNVMTEIKTKYEAKNPGIKLTFNFGSSGPLQKQIEQGAPADLFISAGASQVDALEKENLLASGTRSNLLGNALVLVVPIDNAKKINSFEDITKAELLSMGDPASVPAGKYAQETLKNMKLWDSLRPTSIVYGKDVTQVLTYVENGNVDAGFVYTSDALSSSKVKVVATAPADSHSSIVYPAAAISSSKNLNEDKDFLTYLSGAEAKALFVKYGFKVL